MNKEKKETSGITSGAARDPDSVRRIRYAVDMLPSPVFFIQGSGLPLHRLQSRFGRYIGLPRTPIIGAPVHARQAGFARHGLRTLPLETLEGTASTRVASASGFIGPAPSIRTGHSGEPAQKGGGRQCHRTQYGQALEGVFHPFGAPLPATHEKEGG